MAGFASAIVFVFNAVILEGVSEALYTRVEWTGLFSTTLTYEKIVYFVVSFRVVQELLKSLLCRDIACTEYTEISEEVKRVETYEHSMTSTHRKA